MIGSTNRTRRILITVAFVFVVFAAVAGFGYLSKDNTSPEILDARAANAGALVAAIRMAWLDPAKHQQLKLSADGSHIRMLKGEGPEYVLVSGLRQHPTIVLSPNGTNGCTDNNADGTHESFEGPTEYTWEDNQRDFEDEIISYLKLLGQSHVVIPSAPAPTPAK